MVTELEKKYYLSIAKSLGGFFRKISLSASRLIGAPEYCHANFTHYISDEHHSLLVSTTYRLCQLVLDLILTTNTMIIIQFVCIANLIHKQINSRENTTAKEQSFNFQIDTLLLLGCLLQMISSTCFIPLDLNERVENTPWKTQEMVSCHTLVVAAPVMRMICNMVPG